MSHMILKKTINAATVSRAVGVIRLVTASIMIAGYCSFTAAAADEPRLGLLNAAEISFLMKHAPEINQVVSSGAVVVYGNVIEPPILVTINRDRIDIGGVQVVPRQERPAYFVPKKKADRVHEQYYMENKSGGRTAEDGARKYVAEMMKNGEIGSFEFKNVKSGLQLTVKSGANEWRAHLDALCPSSLSNKYHFMMLTIFRAYEQRKEASGKPAALSWLHSRFEDMKAMGVLATYEFSDEDETVQARFPCQSFAAGFGFYNQTPRELAKEKFWKAREPETRRALDSIIQGLNAGQLHIYTFGFDIKLPPNSATVKILKDVTSGKSDKAQSASLRDTVGLTPEQMEQLLEELR